MWRDGVCKLFVASNEVSSHNHENIQRIVSRPAVESRSSGQRESAVGDNHQRGTDREELAESNDLTNLK